MTDHLFIPNASPLVSFRFLFKTGAASDPAGKEGLAALTAALLAGGGNRRMSYEQILEALYPMATGFAAQTDKEMTVFYGTTHVDNLDRYYEIISGMLLEPGWREDDFERLKEDAINFLRVTLRGNNDEELGKEALYNFIYEGHPYGHHNVGTVAALQRLTLDDAREFYAAHFTGANLTVGLAGGCPETFAARVRDDFAGRLGRGTPATLALPEPAAIKGLEMRVIKKMTPGTAISFGFPIPVTRAHPDWPALLAAQSYFGQHRSNNSYITQRMRQVRGLNYGNYAYIEYFPRGMYQFQPDPNLCRRQQAFQVWVRPVEPQNGLFALRIALYELNKLVAWGMTPEDFEATRRFLSKHVHVLTRTQDAQLGYALDGRHYGIPEFTGYVRDALARMTVDEVNRAIRQYWQAENVKIVVVTFEAVGFRDEALGGRPSPITYATEMPPEVLEEDRIIERYPLNFNREAVEVVPVESVFE